MNTLPLEGKLAMVTGGCRNFGAEIAQSLLDAGARVIITSRNYETAAKAALDKYIPMELDLNSEDSVVALFERVRKQYRRLDILVNNAGGHSKSACGYLEKESLAGWNDFISANLTGTFLMIREYAKLMMDQGGGSVINIASMAGLVGRDRKIYQPDMTPNPIAYSAAKAGVIGLTTDCAAYLGPYGIRVNAISPGGFERSQPEHFIRDYAELTMLKKMGQPGELGGVVVFLASAASNYITGHNLVVDGGFTRYK